MSDMFSKLLKKKKDSQDQDLILKSPDLDAGFVMPTLEAGQLTGKLLIATPFMSDNRFQKAVIFICSHAGTGTIGVIVNHAMDDLDFTDVLRQFDLEPTDDTPDLTVVQGGPVERIRGFVLHSNDVMTDTTQEIDHDLCLTSSLDMLKKMGLGQGPKKALMSLGFTGWDAGQLEKELADNSWLIADYNADLLFEISCNHRWEAAMSGIGVRPSAMTGAVGRA